MKLANLIEKISEKYKENLCEPWDNVGLLIGDKNMEIKKVLLAIDANSKVIDKAIEINADLIITHHPLIFTPLKKIVLNDIISGRIIRLIKENISVYAMHTNLDSANDGLNDYVFKLFNLNAKRIYEKETENRPIRYYEFKNPVTLDEIIQKVKKGLNIDTLKVIADEYYTSNIIKKIAIVTGSGMDFFNEVKDKVDLFLTGDVKYHEAQDSLEYGLPIIDFGHFESEVHVVDLLEKFLLKETDLDIEKCYLGKVFSYK